MTWRETACKSTNSCNDVGPSGDPLEEATVGRHVLRPLGFIQPVAIQLPPDLHRDLARLVDTNVASGLSAAV